ncbi:MAG: Ni/Fe-hydrogenase cytochrome b subunit [Ignavibacteriae bacterium]|nr:Ni/Fe-hydrogenase cytochrome b subunit [Ignavibacteriota bacterium]
MKNYLKSLTFWKTVGTIIITAGIYVTYVRFAKGLGGTTNLSDEFPWGLWIGFDILCGVGLAAGGFTLAAIVHIFHIKRFEPILRPTILTAFLGYLLVIVALLYDLGRPLQIWHAIIMWNPHSVMFEVAWCVMLYTAVLALEFSPVVLEKFNMTRTLKVFKRITLPLIIIGVLLSTLHQSSLGSLYLIVPEKLYPLWYTPYLPVFFFFSAIAVGCAMIIFESFLSARAFKKGLELHLLADIARASVVILAAYLTMKIMDLIDRSTISLLFLPRMETYLYWLEIVVGVVAPLFLLSLLKVRQYHNGLFFSAVMIILGFILNRMNISITGMEAWAGLSYFPTWMEITVTMAIVTVGFIIFRLAAKYLPLFTHEYETQTLKPILDLDEDLQLISQPNYQSETHPFGRIIP